MIKPNTFGRAVSRWLRPRGFRSQFRRTRAALLPTPGDPFLINLWLKSFENVWESEVDKLYVHINSYLPAPVIDSLRRRLDRNPKIETLYDDRMMDHGNSLATLVRHCQEELILLIEDDAFVLKPGAVDACFSAIEQGAYDCLGSPRGSCTMKLFDLGMEKFEKPAIGYDSGPHFWPNFFFCKKKDLLRTDLNLGAHTFKIGDYIPALDYTVHEPSVNGDTFVWASLQLRGLGLKFGYIEQFKVHPNDFEEYRRRDNCFSKKAMWLHSGSLSGSLHSWLRGRDGKPLGASAAAPAVDMSLMPEEAKGHGMRDEFERRVTFLTIALESSKEDFEDLAFFKKAYREALGLLVSRYGLASQKIDLRKTIYQKRLKPVFKKNIFWMDRVHQIPIHS